MLRALGDHVEIRARARRLAEEPNVTPDTLRALGAALSAHVRLEERQLFAIIEEAMPAGELLALARRLQEAEENGDPDTAAARRTPPAVLDPHVRRNAPP